MLPTELIARPGASVPSSCVARSFCSKTRIVFRLGNLISPEFSKIRALAPSHTTTHSPCLIKRDIDHSSNLQLNQTSDRTLASDQRHKSGFVAKLASRNIVSSCHP